ncbi:putative membrane protein [Oopsacas minuta]|uniref:BOS complex subunit TMEM147 n=1 Tax=Oopsacas minuta TaxID=111878 RepID=A0AAV7JSS0_9METZ|nr:putative membrane protein [Oopsacas minuta]
MTFFYFVSSGAVTFAPCLFLWRLTPLADSPFLYRFLTVGAIYIITQFSKFLLIATFFPEYDILTHNFVFIQEFFKCTMYIVELIGMEIALLYFSHKFDYRVLTVGSSWATCQAIASKLLPLWFGGRSYEFSWDVIVLALRSNVELVLMLSTVYLIFIIINSKRYANQSLYSISLLFLITYYPLLISYIGIIKSVSQLMLLIAEFLFSTSVAAGTYLLYSRSLIKV